MTVIELNAFRKFRYFVNNSLVCSVLIENSVLKVFFSQYTVLLTVIIANGKS